MYSQYSFLRNQYEEILTYCDYLLPHSTYAEVLEKVLASKQRAEEYLARLRRESP